MAAPIQGSATMNRRLAVALLGASSLLLAGPIAAQAQQVVVYTAAVSQVVDALVPRFQRETGIKVQVVKAGSSDILRRLRAEASAPKGDVVWSVGAETLEANKELLAPFTPTEAAALVPAYRLSNVWAPYSGIVAVFSVNTEMLKPAEYPHSWKDLADPRWKGRIASARADGSGSAFQQYATVLTVYGDQGPALYKKILDNINFAPSSGVVNRLVSDGEAAVGITLEDDALYFKNNGGPVAVVTPDDGTSTVPDGMGLVRGAPNAEQGAAFLNWLLTKPVQEYVVKETNRRSARVDVAFQGTPLTAMKIIDYDVMKIAANRDALLKQWQSLAAGR
jgi:iron(III) transport system substrate-binding protein